MSTSTFEREERRFSNNGPGVCCRRIDGNLNLCRNVPCSTSDRYCIRLASPLDDLEDVRELCRIAVMNGGTMVREFCFAYADRQQCLAVLELLRAKFGAAKFVPFDGAAGDD